MPKPTTPATAPKGGMARRRPRSGAMSRTNSNCKECNVVLGKNEGENCDECRLTKLGWKKVPAAA